MLFQVCWTVFQRNTGNISINGHGQTDRRTPVHIHYAATQRHINPGAFHLAKVYLVSNYQSLKHV